MTNEYARGFDDGATYGIAEGERRMLWLMAIGASWSRAMTDDYERAGVAYEVQWFALCALSNMGDARALECLR